jgi:hypothetical protein
MSNLSATRPQYNEQIGETTKGEGVSFSDPMNKFIDDVIQSGVDTDAAVAAVDVRVTALEVTDTVHVIGSAGEIPFANGWIPYGAPYPSPYYYLEGSMVHMDGLIKSGTVNAVMFTLPVGYRPSGHELISVVSNNVGSRLDVKPNGDVLMPFNGSNTFTSLRVSFSIR